MSAHLPKSVEKVIEQFQRLPGVGPKSAARMAYHYLRSPYNDAVVLADALREMDEKVKFCQQCFNISEEDVCEICSHAKLRDNSQLCVVEDSLDISAIEQSAIFRGVYFVLGGLISPAEGIGPDELRFPQLKSRVKMLLKELGSDDKEISEGQGHEILEVIVATNPSLEGEATSSYLADYLKEFIASGQIKVTRLAMGLPTGADLEYADRLTLKRSLEGRSRVEL